MEKTKNCLEINKWEKRTFSKIFHSLQIFLDLKCLVDDWVDELMVKLMIELLLYLKYNTLDEVDRGEVQKEEKTQVPEKLW